MLHRFFVQRASKPLMIGVSRKTMLTTMLSFTALWIFATATPAQGTSQPTLASIPQQRVNLYGRLLGSVVLPVGFRGYMTADYDDAWAGYLESTMSGFKMNWRAGLIEYVLEKGKLDIEWQKEEKVGDVLIKRVSLKGKDGKTLVSKIGWMEFSSFIRNSDDETTFDRLVDSYQQGQCGNCPSLPRRIDN